MNEGIIAARLDWFTDDADFPFFIQYGEHEQDLYIHSHDDFHELVIVMEGSAIHVVNNEEYSVKKGDVFVVGNDTVHGYTSPENFHICNIMYRHKEIFAALPDIASSAGFQALFVLEPRITKEQSFQNRLKIGWENYRTVKDILDSMIQEYESNLECRKTLLISRFTQLAVMLSRFYSFDSSEKEHDIINIAKSISYIENHYRESIPVAKLAELSGYSERHFTRIFRNAYQCSPTEYIINLRISRACAFLQSSRLTVSEAAEKCGFDDVNYFSRLFKKRIGVSPSKYGA